MDIKDSIKNIISKYAVVGKNYIHQSRKINGYEFFWFEEISKLFSEQKPDVKWLLDSLSNHTKIRHFVICWLEDEQMQTISIPVLKEDKEATFSND